MTNHNKQTKKIQSNERGFASIVIALLLIIILALLSIGFAQLARREQQNTLDKQLSSQAYDAAESGVNDAYHDITTIDPNLPATAQYPQGQPYINISNAPSSGTCVTAGNVPALNDPGADSNNPTINGQNGVSYTCLMVNLQPPNLLYNNVFPNTSRTITFSTPTTDSTLASLTFKWTTADNKTGIPPFPGSSSGGFDPVSSWNSPAVLEVSITPLSATDRTSLINNTFTTYLYPSNSNATIAYAPNATAPGQQGLLTASSCNSSGSCTGTITGLNLSPGAAPGEWYILHVLDYYDESQTLTVNGTDTGGASVSFIGQDQIDVTGKARYVLKNLQERVQPVNNPNLPNYAVQGQNVCKRFDTYPAATTPDSTIPALSNCSNFN